MRCTQSLVLRTVYSCIQRVIKKEFEYRMSWQPPYTGAAPKQSQIATIDMIRYVL